MPQGSIRAEFIGSREAAMACAVEHGFNLPRSVGLSSEGFPQLSLPFKNVRQREEAIAKFLAAGFEREGLEVRQYHYGPSRSANSHNPALHRYPIGASRQRLMVAEGTPAEIATFVAGLADTAPHISTQDAAVQMCLQLAKRFDFKVVITA